MRQGRRLFLIAGLALVYLSPFTVACKSQPFARSIQDTIHILQAVISYPALQDSLLTRFENQQMTILENEIIHDEYDLQWNGQKVSYEKPTSVNTSPDLDMPPRLIIDFPDFRIEGDTSQVVYRFKNAGLIAKFELIKGEKGYWQVVSFETWHI